MSFYVGDLCHVLPRRIMDTVMDNGGDWVDSGDDRLGRQWVYYEYDGEVGCVDDYTDFPEGYDEEGDRDKEMMFSIYPTWNGDGRFYDKEGNSYGVDMGCLGVVSITPEIEEMCKERESQGLGKVYSDDYFETTMGNPPSEWCSLPKLYRNGKGCFIIGERVIIPT